MSVRIARSLLIGISLAAWSSGCLKSYDLVPPDGEMDGMQGDANGDAVSTDGPADAGPAPPAPQSIYPLSGARQTGALLVVVKSPNAAVARIDVDVCSSHDCSNVITTVSSMGTQVAATTNVTLSVADTMLGSRALVWWRASSVSATGARSAYTPVWELFRIRRGSAHSLVIGHEMDADADGHVEFIAGAPGTSPGTATDTGNAFIVTYDPTSRALNSVVLDHSGASDRFGGVVAAAGDLNGDGYGDVAIATRPSSGANGFVYVYYGNSSGTPALLTGSMPIGPPANNSNFGGAVAGIDDFDGDGFGDLAIGAPDANSSTGAVYIYRGSVNGVHATPDVTLPPPTGAGAFGSALATFGESLDSQNRQGFIVGASPDTPTGGRVYVYAGGSMSASGPLAAIGMSSNFGTAVAGGDIDGDALPDVVATGPGGTAPGASVYFGNGMGGTVMPAIMLPPASASGGFGASVAVLENETGTDTARVMVGAFDPTSNPAGVVQQFGFAMRVLDASGGQVIRAPTSPPAPLQFGASLCNVGDVDADGASDLVIGAPGDSTLVGQGPSAAYLLNTGGFSTFQPGTSMARALGTSVAMDLQRAIASRWRCRS